ncbi:hypothetical protein C4K00_2302 [Pseudomonas synxantha]|nr:hypothetical protein C4K00_2302 [Pseudomonas synxantha]AZE78201.1 hypothetical protein C4J99_2416 [Pseudomonas synxantha]
MIWDIEYTDEFGDWWGGLDAKEQSSVAASVDLLGLFGPGLRFPHSSDIKGARHGNLRELRDSIQDDLSECCTSLTSDVVRCCS